MTLELPAYVSAVLHRLQAAGFEAYVVGGCVRDSLLHKMPADWDVTTSARPEQILEVFRNERTIPTGLKHGTVTVLLENTPVEITTYRIDGTYTDGRHPDSVEFTASLQEDLQRRDFTINALAYSPETGLDSAQAGAAESGPPSESPKPDPDGAEPSSDDGSEENSDSGGLNKGITP